MPSPSPAPPVPQQHNNSSSINAIYQAAQASKARDQQLLKKAIHGIVIEPPVINLTSIKSKIDSIHNKIKSICNKIHTAPLIALTVERITETTETITKTTNVFVVSQHNMASMIQNLHAPSQSFTADVEIPHNAKVDTLASHLRCQLDEAVVLNEGLQNTIAGLIAAAKNS